MNNRLTCLVLMLVAVCVGPLLATAQDTATTTEERITTLEKKVTWLDYKVRSFAAEGAVAFLFGAFCALWAQNTRRNPWLWFFLGLLFSVVTVLVLLYKNSNPRRE